ncbi:hypothetical protein [Aeromicrobium sp. CTD01-1L150]|uniref:hypothetical protein n=1 Tax=Aeromicrobium sp. CTD01-1L150 TaxID=3341830 RepID=UPI0035BFC331
MADFGLVTIVLVFFGLAHLYVRACDRIVGRDTPGVDLVSGPDGPQGVDEGPLGDARLGAGTEGGSER